MGEVDKLGTAPRKAIERHDLVASPAAVLELELLHDVGRLKPSASQVIEVLGKDLMLRVCDLPFRTVMQHSLSETWRHDPFDRLIAANAKANSATLISKDERIHQNYRRTVW